MIIAFEGVDGAGKNTLVTAVEAELIAREIPVAKVGFPRYEESAAAHLVREALHRRMGDLTDSVNGMAALFALDRHEIAADLESLDTDGYVVLIDRFTASNAAYSMARIGGPDADGAEEIVEWVRSMEQDALGIPAPHLQVLVDVDADVAGERAKGREAADSSRARDSYETDGALQHRTVAAYRHLANTSWVSPWNIVDSTNSELSDVRTRAEDIADTIQQLANEEE